MLFCATAKGRARTFPFRPQLLIWLKFYKFIRLMFYGEIFRKQDIYKNKLKMHLLMLLFWIFLEICVCDINLYLLILEQRHQKLF